MCGSLLFYVLFYYEGHERNTIRSWLASGAASASEQCISRGRGMLMKYLPAELFNAFKVFHHESNECVIEDAWFI